jgi:antitoxin VapB
MTCRARPLNSKILGIYLGYVSEGLRSDGEEDHSQTLRNGRSQAVRLPQEFHFEGDRVRVRSFGHGVLLQPGISDPVEWFAELDRLNAEPFVVRGRKQPKAARRKIFE